jgi:hypothetical protein
MRSIPRTARYIDDRLSAERWFARMNSLRLRDSLAQMCALKLSDLGGSTREESTRSPVIRYLSADFGCLSRLKMIRSSRINSHKQAAWEFNMSRGPYSSRSRNGGMHPLVEGFVKEVPVGFVPARDPLLESLVVTVRSESFDPAPNVPVTTPELGMTLVILLG